jgi:DNA-binding transcriptional MocR family regulator
MDKSLLNIALLLCFGVSLYSLVLSHNTETLFFPSVILTTLIGVTCCLHFKVTMFARNCISKLSKHSIVNGMKFLSSQSAGGEVFSADKVSSVFKKLKVGPMKRLYKYYTAGAVNLAGGLPMDSTFPLTRMDVHLNDESSFELQRGKDLFLNYHRGDGLPPVKEWIQRHVNELHQPINHGTESCITVGSTDAWAKILTLVDSDVVLFDQHAYGAAVNACESLGKKSIGVKTDDEGMIPSELRDAVNTARANGLTANIVYFVPVGQNPTGNTISPSRKADLYRVCKELDVIIVEDGNYLFLS